MWNISPTTTKCGHDHDNKKRIRSRSPRLSLLSHPRVQLQCLGFSVTIENMILFYKSFDVIVAILDQVNCNRALAREIVILQTTWNLHLHCYWISLRKNLSQVASSQNIPEDRVAEVAREHGWHPPKSLDSDENFKPEHTLFCRELRFVAIYALFFGGYFFRGRFFLWILDINLQDFVRVFFSSNFSLRGLFYSFHYLPN